MASSEGRRQNNLSLGWEATLNADKLHVGQGKETGILPHYYFHWNDMKFYIKKEENKWTSIGMEHFNSILIHNSGPPNNQHINQSINNRTYLDLC